MQVKVSLKKQYGLIVDLPQEYTGLVMAHNQEKEYKEGA